MTVEIAISHGKTALIDVADQHLIAGRNWYYEHGYARARIGGKRGRWVYMHRIILGSPKGAVDHINRNGLDNRRSNLRVCNQRDNSRNQGLRKNNTSGFKGVTWRRDIRKWAAKITVNRKTIDLGAHDNAADAALAYDRAAAGEIDRDDMEAARAEFAEAARRLKLKNPIGLAGPQGIAGSVQHPEQLCRVERVPNSGSR